MKTETAKHTPFVIKHTSGCAEDCSAFENGIRIDYDTEGKEYVINAVHDLEPCEGFYGASWQSFGSFKTREEAEMAVAAATK